MIRPVILCGGAGTRLWPLSRQLFPKQLLTLTGEQSLLQQTALRLASADFAAAIVVAGEQQRFFIKSQLEEAGVPVEGILLEPVARNTLAAAAVAAAWLKSTGRDDLLLLVPSDHIILNRTAFLEAVAVGAPHAEQGAIVTFGAQPTEPNTQYGYIEAAIEERESAGALPIARFVEKPDSETAAEYLASGCFYWNAGIFLLKSSTLLDEMRRFLPDSFDAINAAATNATTEGIFIRPQAEAFKRVENISIDHGIMEKTSRGMVVPVQMDWSDVGSWDAVWKLGSKDADNNVSQGDVLALDTRGSLLRSERGGPLIAAVGLDEMVVIALQDAVLVAPIGRVSDVKSIVESLKADGRDCVMNPRTLAQSWGWYERVTKGPGFNVAHMVVNVGANLPLAEQTANAKRWVIVRGSAEITLGDRVSCFVKNDSIDIPAGTLHSLRNLEELPLELIEIEFAS